MSSKIFIVSAPAGTGKTTLVRKLVDEFPNIIQSISYTSRSPRLGEIAGKDYHFISKEEFKKKIIDGDFLEYAEIYGHYYGTDRAWVQSQLQAGKNVVLVIDTQGAMKLKGKVEAVYIFILPPSLKELKARLEKRQTEDPDIQKERLSWAEHEIEVGQSYDYKIVNDDLESAYRELRNIVEAIAD